MSLILHNEKKTLIVQLLGDLDLVSADEIREKIDQSLKETRAQNLLFDLSQNTFMDSSGLGVLLGRFRHIKEKQGQMIIWGVQPALRKILQLSGIMSLIPICDTEKEAWGLLEERSVKEA